MTTNQLAYQNNKEVERHNRVMEEKTTESNKIAAEKNYITQQYQDRMVDLEEARLAWQKGMDAANLEQKKFYEGMLAEVNYQKAQTEAAYYGALADYNRQQNAIKAFAATEEARHNKALESSAYFSNILKWNEISNDAYLRKLSLDQEFQLRSKQIENQTQLNNYQNAYWQGMLNNQGELLTSQKFANYASGIGNIGRGVGSVLENLNLFKGLGNMFNPFNKNGGSNNSKGPMTWDELFGGK